MTDYTPLSDNLVAYYARLRADQDAARLAREVQARRNGPFCTCERQWLGGGATSEAHASTCVLRLMAELEQRRAAMKYADDLGIDVDKLVRLICPPPCETCKGSERVLHLGVEHYCPDCHGRPKATLYDRLDTAMNGDADHFCEYHLSIGSPLNEGWPSGACCRCGGPSATASILADVAEVTR